MRAVDLLARREASWRELDRLLLRFEGASPREPADSVFGDGAGPPRPPAASWRQRIAAWLARLWPGRRVGAADVVRLGELYRAACADLMRAEAHDLPRETVAYLHALVARGHNAVYRARGFRLARWAVELLDEVPRRLRDDPTLRLSALVFFGTFVAFALLGAGRPGFAEAVVGPEALESFERMYDGPTVGRDDAQMAGFYIQHNASLGLQCFAWGLAFGLGTLYVLLANAMMIGVTFGHMALTPQATRFYAFVTAHAPFELSAIVFSGAAGLRLGWGLIRTRGQTRLASLRREARSALPTVGAAVFLFVLAAFLEGFVSASSWPYAAKAAIALASAALLAAYLLLGGRRKSRTAPPGSVGG
jgi:uncharacterized membrane protein SpoIIM required for sporulation